LVAACADKLVPVIWVELGGSRILAGDAAGDFAMLAAFSSVALAGA
jgi:hypothetical protein